MENKFEEQKNVPHIIASGGGGGGGGSYGSRGGDGGSVNIGIMPNDIKIDRLKNPHKSYWGFLLKQIARLIFKHTTELLIVIAATIIAGIWLKTHGY